MMKNKILVMGLPGSGKTTLAEKLKLKLQSLAKTVDWYNADTVRADFNDWDFSHTGRIRQSLRMADLASNSSAEYVIADFVAPLAVMRTNFNPEWIIWMDTIDEGRFIDTNNLFEKPSEYDFRITEQNSEFWAEYIVERIINNRRRPFYDYKKETVQLLGRWQPWHKGHRALFERAIKKTGQVCIMVRDCRGWQNSNPFDFEKVKTFIERDLDPLYQGQYEIILVPNIVNITYGRSVGYTIEEEIFDETITSISATKIRKEMGLE